MVKLEEHKHETENSSIEKLPAPARAYIPLSQHIGKACVPLVKAGDIVSLGQKIASAEAHVFAPVHASISGKVIGIQDWPHPVLGRSKVIVIENDGLDKPEGSGLPSDRPEGHGLASFGQSHRQSHKPEGSGLPSDRQSHRQSHRQEDEINNFTPDQIRNIVFEAGIVGMGGASFPAHIKLKPPRQVDTLIINGAECEPYLTCDYRLMIEKASQILKGIELVARCLGVKDIYIAIEDNKPQAIKAFEAIRDKPEGNGLPSDRPEGHGLASFGQSHRQSHKRYAISVLKSMYPQGGEKQLIKNVLKIEVPSGKLPFDIGVVVQNVATVFAVYEAAYLNKPLYERVVTVSGSCITHPKNLLVRIGTPIKELINFCGLKEEPAKIIIGGPMMGIAQFSDDVAVIKSTTGIILFSRNEAKVLEEEFCIRCGACVRECPVNLMPTLINLASRKELWQEAKKYGVADCIECGLCNYVCPSHIGLVQAIKRAKLAFK
ncbi:MAG: electron transport complex subunit RsxC [Candidatus Omnitrophota bacterium]